jgi:arginine decarboxylase
MLDGYVDNLHFDEAWLPHAEFHPFYGAYHAMGKKRPRPQKSVVYATQSIHKLLAGISQASHVLVQDSQSTKLDRHLFNEAYLMHTSHQPAVQHHRQLRCGRRHDGAARRHRAGRRKHCRGAGLPPRHAQGRRGVRHDDWWFKVWGPDELVEEGIGRSSDWVLNRKKDAKRTPRKTGTALATWRRASTCWTPSRRPSSPLA